MTTPAVGPAVVITLDTCCVSAVAHQEVAHASEVVAIEKLIDLARARRVRLQLTASYERDFGRLRDEEKRDRRLAWLADAPTIDYVGGVFRLDVSNWDGLDVLAGDDESALAEQVQHILARKTTEPDVLPGYEDQPGKAAKMLSDTDHVTAHAMSGAAWFATVDTKTILRHRVALAAIDIHVALPTEILTHLDG